MALGRRPKRTPALEADAPDMEDAPVTHRGAAPRNVAVFRRADDTICHARCGRPLSLQGVRGSLEADFYCFACLTHVTMPLAVLDSVPVEPRIAAAEAMAAS